MSDDEINSLNATLLSMQGAIGEMSGRVLMLGVDVGELHADVRELRGEMHLTRTAWQERGSTLEERLVPLERAAWWNRGAWKAIAAAGAAAAAIAALVVSIWSALRKGG